MRNVYTALIGLVLVVLSCKETAKKEEGGSYTTKEATISQQEPLAYSEGTTDEAIASKIKHYLVTDYLKKELNIIPTEERKFQFQTIDLNNDGKQELFINFVTRYFCGTGGCTLLLLSDDWRMINEFSVTRTPIMVEPHEGKEWAMLMVKESGVWKELNFRNGKYPSSHPSQLPKSRFDAPSGHAQAIFSEEFAPAKTFDF